MSAYGQVWDAEGDVVWEGTGSSRVVSSTANFQTLSAEDQDFGAHSAKAAQALFEAIIYDTN